MSRGVISRIEGHRSQARQQRKKGRISREQGVEFTRQIALQAADDLELAQALGRSASDEARVAVSQPIRLTASRYSACWLRDLRPGSADAGLFCQRMSGLSPAVTSKQ